MKSLEKIQRKKKVGQSRVSAVSIKENMQPNKEILTDKIRYKDAGNKYLTDK